MRYERTITGDSLPASIFGSEPPPDRRTLLAPITVTETSQAARLVAGDAAPFESLSLVAWVQRSGLIVTPEELAFVAQVWGEWSARAALGSPRLWAQSVQTEAGKNAPQWIAFSDVPLQMKIAKLALAWELNTVLSSSAADTARDFARYVGEAGRRIAPLGWTLALNRMVEEAAVRAQELVAIKTRFARSVELRLVPQGKPFFARTVWQMAFSLGMEWAQPVGVERPYFLWPGREGGAPLFFVNTNEAHGVLSPESAARNETVPGLAFYFELPTNPAPVETFDRMAIAVNYFAHTLNGRPVTATGRELDADALDDLRDDLAETVQEMARLGLAPGSPEAARFF